MFAVLLPAVTTAIAIGAAHLGGKGAPKTATVVKFAVVGAGLGILLAPRPKQTTSVDLVGAQALLPLRSRARKKMAALEAAGFEAQSLETPWGTFVLSKKDSKPSSASRRGMNFYRARPGAER